jgi:protein-S-isoprenylcysteine O-methyltransferase Ste14
MDRIRHVLGVLAIVLYGPGLLYWFLIHPWARRWRRLGPTKTYLIVGPTLAVIGVLLFPIRGPLLGRDLGTNWILIGLGTILLALLAWLGLAYGRHMTHLNLTTRMGIPELSSQTRQPLVRDGLYGIVRHPVYLSAILWGIPYALIVNYVGTYVLFAAALPVFYAITALEERELVDRFGESYRQYQREVPRLIPRWRKTS